MPVFSDFHRKLQQYGVENKLDSIIKLSNTLKMFTKGGIYDLFDRHTSSDLKEFAMLQLLILIYPN